MNLELIGLKHKDVLEKYGVRKPQISEHTFTNLFVWRNSRPLSIIESEGSIIIAAHRGSELTLFGPPIGGIQIANAVSHLEKHSGEKIEVLECIPEAEASAFDADGWTAIEDRSNFDYVYKRGDLAELSGRRYHAKRNLITQCTTQYDCTYEEISGTTLPEVIQMVERWCAVRACKNKPGLCHEYQALMETFKHYRELGVFGGVIRIAGQIEAFTIGEALSEDTAVIHFEKAMPKFKGLYQTINQWFCKNRLSNFEFVNREQDLGIEGLRRAKESYYPDHFVKKFLIHRGDGLKHVQDTMKPYRCPE